MKVKVFAVYDSKLEAYLAPQFMQTNGQMVRAWETAVNDPSTQFSKHPADFTLFAIGEYDDATGDLIPFQSKISFGTALEAQVRAENLYSENVKRSGDVRALEQ